MNGMLSSNESNPSLRESVHLKGHLQVFARSAGSDEDWKLVVDRSNLIVTTGKTLVRNLLSGAETSLYLTGFAFGTGTGTPVAGDTDLGTAVAYSGANKYKVFLETSNPSSTSIKFVGFFSTAEPVTQPVDLTECGLFTGTGTSGGTMFSRVTFAAINKTTSLELRMEYTIQI